MKLKLIASALAIIASVGIVHAAGYWDHTPTLGVPGNTVCESFGSTPSPLPGAAGNCNEFKQPGTVGLTGSELIPSDTGLSGNQMPQTQTIPTSMLGNSLNRLIGGDMTTSLAQRLSTTKGIASLATLSPTAAVMTTDGWWVVAPAAGVTVTMDSTAATAVIPGQNNTKAIRVARTSSGAAGNMCFGQTLDAAASAPLIGQNAVFSFFEQNGPAMSATSGNITVNIDYSSAADTAASQTTLGFAGTNGKLFALGDTGAIGTGPTNMTRAVSGFSNGTTGTVTAGVATITASTTWTRYGVYASIPTTIPGTATLVTNVSVSICFAPILTTAISTDWIELNFMQLEAKPSTVTTQLPNGVTTPSAFERRQAALEQAVELSYWYYNFENQTAITTVASCTDVSVTVANCLIPFPQTMRIAPAMSYTNGFQLFTTTAYSAVGACTTLSASASYVTVSSLNGVLVNCTAGTVPAAGTANNLTTLGTGSATGIIVASALP